MKKKSKTKLKYGDKVSVYGYGANTSCDLHDGCKAWVSEFSEERNCEGNKITLIGVIFYKDTSFEWFHSKQLRKVVKK